MSKVFVIRNQHGHYLGKQQNWLDGSDRRLLYRTVHRDEAVNLVFEHSSKDIALRAEPLLCEVDKNGQPQVDAGPEIPLQAAAKVDIANRDEGPEDRMAPQNDGEAEAASAEFDDARPRETH